LGVIDKISLNTSGVKDGKAMVRYETTDEWGETIHHIVQFASFRRWAKRATVLYAAEVLSK
jgi:hypothetical protein